jgi:hypothetical protein
MEDTVDLQRVEKGREVGGENLRRRFLDILAIAPARITEAAQVRDNHGEVLRQRADVLLVAAPELGPAMQQHQGCAFPFPDVVDHKVGGLDFPVGEIHRTASLRYNAINL